MAMLATFQQALTAATLAAARAAVVDHGTERIYSFALYTSGDYAYVDATLATETGLATVAGRYLAEAPYRARWGDLATASRELRWSPCDSPHHEAYTACFEEAAALLDELWAAVDEADATYDEQYDRLIKAIHETMIQSLIALRDSQILPADVVLNLLQGDQGDDARLANSARVNGPATHRVLVQDMAR